MTKSMFSLSDFKSSIKSNGVARDTRFEVVIYPPTTINTNSKEISIRCHTAFMPPFNLKTRDYIVGQGQTRKMPVNFDNGMDLEFTFYNNYKGSVYADLLKWAKMVSPNSKENDHTINFVSDILGNVYVQQLDEQDNVRQGWELKDAYPIIVDTISLDSGHLDAVQLVKVHITYRYAITLDESASLNELTSPDALFNQAIGSYKNTDKTYGGLTTAKGNYKNRTRVYDPYETPDPTLVTAVTTAKGTGLTPDELYTYTIQYISSTRNKGSGFYTDDQLLFMGSDVQNMNSAINTGDSNIISTTFAAFSNAYNSVKSKATSFFSNVADAIKSYMSVKDNVPTNDPIHSEMSSLQSTYNSVYTEQLSIDATYNNISKQVNSPNSNVSITIA